MADVPVSYTALRCSLGDNYEFTLAFVACGDCGQGYLATALAGLREFSRVFASRHAKRYLVRLSSLRSQRFATSLDDAGGREVHGCAQTYVDALAICFIAEKRAESTRIAVEFVFLARLS